MRRLSSDMTARLGELRHVDMSQVAIAFSQTRHGGRYGVYASLTPLRFAGGQSKTVRRGRTWTIPRLLQNGREMLYILTFYLPRFLDLPLGEKLVTVTHELWHISPQFDGDLRRYRGRCYAHSGSKRSYDARARQLAADWLSREPARELYDFLDTDFRGLLARFGPVYGQRIRAPKLRPED
jgi:predicted metallopeptidase